MDFGLSEEQREIQRTAQDLLGERARPERVREHAQARSTDERLWRELCELGWPGIAVDERYGGQGLGCVELSILAEELGRSLAPVPLLASMMAAAVIEHAGSEEQRERLLPGLASGAVLGAVGVAAAGTAELVLGAPRAQVLVLLEDAGARVLDAGETQVTQVLTIDPTREAGRVQAPVDAGEPLAGDVAGATGRALVALSSELVGVSEQALQMTVAYVKERRQFGVPVGSYQAVSHRCAQMLLDTEQARSTTAFAAWSADADPDGLAEAAAMAKSVASDTGRAVTAGAIQLHGGIGFTWEADVHWYYKRAQIDAALLGAGRQHRAALAAILAARSQLHAEPLPASP